jgi:hypothetical protein
MPTHLELTATLCALSFSWVRIIKVVAPDSRTAVAKHPFL